jgi:NodT family efflux transporter outer membrane factor (OMF) lipoprotein
MRQPQPKRSDSGERRSKLPVSGMFGASTRLWPFACFVLLSGCAVGPKYVQPTVSLPPAYKELTPKDFSQTAGWKVAEPSDAAVKGKWWEIFNEPQLNALEERAAAANQNIAAAAANFEAARALVRQARSKYYPSITVNPSITNSRPSLAQFGGIQGGGQSGSSSGFALNSFTSYSLPFDASWQPDLWSRVRNTVRANVAAAQASAADLENVRLTVQSEVASEYFEIRSQDALKQLLDATVAAYKDSYELTEIQFNAGIAADEAVAQAETQLESTQAADTNLGIARSQFEHAIALLLGEPASTFSLETEPLRVVPPGVPLGVPAQLLERRPDIASAERLVAQANAQIGVAKAAFYPDVTLGASAGLGNSSFVDWFTWPSRFWSVGPSLVQTLFDAGQRRAALQQSQATYDQTVADYRQIVLGAFQQVEDNLAALRILSQEIEQQDAAVQSAQRNLQMATLRYRAGIDPYLNVIVAQTLLLGNQQTSVNLRRDQMIATVQLVEALGGGWDIRSKTAQINDPLQR